MKSKNQFIEAGWRFNHKGEEVLSVMTLVYAEGPRRKQVAERGDIVTSGDGERLRLIGGSAPHKPSSTGRIHVKDESGFEAQYFPSVCGLRWKPISRRAVGVQGVQKV